MHLEAAAGTYSSSVSSLVWVSCTKQHEAFKAAGSICKVVVTSVQTPMRARHGDWQIATPSLTSECVVLKLEALVPTPVCGRSRSGFKPLLTFVVA